MAFSEIELKRINKQLDQYLEAHRPPVAIREQLDIGYRVEQLSVEIFEIRPDLGDSTDKIQIPIAKAVFMQTKRHWKIQWQKSDLKWHAYQPLATVRHFEDFLKAVAEDEYGCFWG